MTKWLEIVRFELAYQLTRRSTWVLLALFMFPLVGIILDELAGRRRMDMLFHAPLFVAQGGVVMGVVALLILAVVVGDAASRDVRTRIEPLMHAAPVGRGASRPHSDPSVDDRPQIVGRGGLLRRTAGIRHRGPFTTSTPVHGDLGQHEPTGKILVVGCVWVPGRETK